MSCIFGEKRDIFFPKLSENLHLITFAEIAEKYLKLKGLEPYLCSTEGEARSFFNNIQNKKQLHSVTQCKTPCNTVKQINPRQ